MQRTRAAGPLAAHAPAVRVVLDLGFGATTVLTLPLPLVPDHPARSDAVAAARRDERGRAVAPELAGDVERVPGSTADQHR